MDKVKVEMTAEEQARFAQFKAEEEKKAAGNKLSGGGTQPHP